MERKKKMEEKSFPESENLNFSICNFQKTSAGGEGRRDLWFCRGGQGEKALKLELPQGCDRHLRSEEKTFKQKIFRSVSELAKCLTSAAEIRIPRSGRRNGGVRGGGRGWGDRRR
ncbi:hypothetical protein RUM43_008748 [Polyplax serrata]|uniref:Uncharacterized protein n=1 Tax=Polyplax serrata TaxID=468196 RepID=A0AAN8PAC2_POLSC